MANLIKTREYYRLFRVNCKFFLHLSITYRVYYVSNTHFLGKIDLLILLVKMHKILQILTLAETCLGAMSGRYPKIPPQKYLLRML